MTTPTNLDLLRVINSSLAIGMSEDVARGYLVETDSGKLAVVHFLDEHCWHGTAFGLLHDSGNPVDYYFIDTPTDNKTYDLTEITITEARLKAAIWVCEQMNCQGKLDGSEKGEDV